MTTMNVADWRREVETGGTMSGVKGRVLVVDDDIALAEMLGIVLRAEGFEPFFCADGAKALNAFRDSKPDLVLLDLMLPGRDGIDVCRQIRAESGVPIVMLTAKSDTVDVVLGLESGADDYVVKPFKPKELVARVRTRLRRTDQPGPETLTHRRPRDRRRRPLGEARRRGRSRSPRWSSTCSPRSRASRGRSSPARSCCRRCGATGTPPTPASSTSTCSACARRSSTTPSVRRSSSRSAASATRQVLRDRRGDVIA